MNRQDPCLSDGANRLINWARRAVLSFDIDESFADRLASLSLVDAAYGDLPDRAAASQLRRLPLSSSKLAALKRVLLDKSMNRSEAVVAGASSKFDSMGVGTAACAEKVAAAAG
jgi:hypothetical protein